MLSSSALSNNIGSLLFRKGDISEATRYLNSAIEENSSSCETKRAGLVWFLRKLERQSYDGAVDEELPAEDDFPSLPPPPPLVTSNSHDTDTTDQTSTASIGGGSSSNSPLQRPKRLVQRADSARRCLTIAHHVPASPVVIRKRSILTRECSRRTSFVEAALTHEPLCNENTPLGFEYFSEPLLLSTDDDSSNDSALVKTVVLINLALIQYEESNNKSNIQNVMQTLRTAVDELPTQSLSSNYSSPSVALYSAVLHSNIGVCLVHLSQPKEALKYIEKANENIDEFRIQNFHSSFDRSDNNDEVEKVYRLYIHITVLLNYARLCIRLNNPEKSSITLEELATLSESIPSRNHYQHHHYHYGSLINRMRWISTVGDLYVNGMIYHRKQQLNDALNLYRQFLTKSRHELGHDHMHVATVLYYKGMILFDQRKLQQAMLSQLASLRIHESRINQQNSTQMPTIELFNDNPNNASDNNNADMEEMARVLYAVGRTLHDREEYLDALRMYTRALELQKSLMNGQISFDAVTTMCNLARVHHIIGDLDASLKINQDIVHHAKRLTGGKKHPFVADRLVILGNILVELGDVSSAMDAYADAARLSTDDDVSRSNNDSTADRPSSTTSTNSTSSNTNNNVIRRAINRTNVSRFSPASPYDVDGRMAVSLAKAGLQHPCAAMA